MKLSTSIFALATCLIAGTATVLLTSASNDATIEQGPAGGKGAKGPGGASIDGNMQVLQGNMKKIEKFFAGDKKDLASVLPMLVEMQSAAGAAKVGTPEKAGAISEKDKKEEFLKGFRHQMIQLQKALLETEEAVIDGKADDAAKVWNEKVKPAKKDGHDKYKEG